MNKYKTMDDIIRQIKRNDELIIILLEGRKKQGGYIYIIENKAWDGWCKIGRASNIETRLKLYQTSSPFRDYVCSYSFTTENVSFIESLIHKHMRNIGIESRNEWFKIEPPKASDIVENIINENRY